MGRPGSTSEPQDAHLKHRNNSHLAEADVSVKIQDLAPTLLLFSRSVLSDSVTPWAAARQASLSITISQSLLRLTSIESVTPSNHLVLCCPLLLLPLIFPSITIFSKSTLCISWPKYWSFSFSISPSNDYSGMIFFRVDWFDLCAVQGILKSLLQHHSSKASILWHSAINSHIHT